MLEALPVGEAMMVPGGFALEESFSPFLLVLDRFSEDKFKVAVVNPGYGSAEFHISSATSAPPKIQTRFTMSFDDIERSKLLDDG